jgi:membrane protein DedA with SNARE-associated domain
VTTSLLAFLTTLTDSFGYVGLALLMIVAAPELVLPFAGFLVARGELSAPGVLAASAAGAMLGQGLIYSFAKTVGQARVRAFFRRYGKWLLLSESDLDAALQVFGRLETAAVVFGRAVPTLRSLISIPAGLKPMPLGRFLFLTTLGTVLWNTLLLYAGMLLGQNWGTLTEVLETYQTGVLALLGLLLTAFVVLRLRARVVRSRSH